MVCPEELSPQQLAVPERIAHEWEKPEVTELNPGPAGGVVRPFVDLPQQASTPVVRMAQAWAYPTATSLKDPLGAVACPRSAARSAAASQAKRSIFMAMRQSSAGLPRRGWSRSALC